MKRANVSLGSSPYGLGLSVCTLGICWGARKSPVLRWAGLEGPSCLLDVPPKENNPGRSDLVPLPERNRAAPPIMAAILGATIYDWFHRRNWLRIARGRLADGDPDGTRDRRSAGRPPLSQPTVKFSSSAGPRAMSLPMRRRVGPTKAPTAARGFPLPLDGPLPPGPARFGPVSP